MAFSSRPGYSLFKTSIFLLVGALIFLVVTPWCPELHLTEEVSMYILQIRPIIAKNRNVW
ncbi:MAG: hypothetical protein II994_03410 [Lachnospiraceae bacterium]|nr:hypothetical protein [Lachnospiraceae bacterium]